MPTYAWVVLCCRAFTYVSPPGMMCAYSGGSGCFLRTALVAVSSAGGGSMMYDAGAISGKLVPNASWARK